MTNSERRISRVRAAVAAPGEARDDWRVATEFAQRLEQRLGRGPARGAPSLFAYETVESIWNEHRETTRGRDLDITGLDYTQLDVAPAQWPWPEGSCQGAERLYVDGRFPTADGRARFVDAPYAAPAEARDARFAFALNTGRLRDQWHGMSRTGSIGRLFGHSPEPVVEMNGEDMARLCLVDGDLVAVTSRRGAIVLPAQKSAAQAPAQVFIAMHWGEEFVSGRGSGDGKDPRGGGALLAGVNALTQPAFCAQSKQPELKHAAVKVVRAELPARVLALAWLSDERALAVREALRPLMADFAFASCVPFGRKRTGVLFRAAAAAPVAPGVLAAIEALLGLDGNSPGARLHYADGRRGQHRTVRLSGSAESMRLEGFLLAGDIAAEAWIRPLLQEELPAAAYGRSLLIAGRYAPVALASRGRQVCTCLDVSEREIVAALARADGAAGTSDALLRLVQAELKCGTQCGSCLPEVRRLVRNAAPGAAVPQEVSAATIP